jgi:hypothetical protein
MELVYGVSHVYSVYFKTWVAIDFSTGCDSSDHSCYTMEEERRKKMDIMIRFDIHFWFIM